MEETVTISLQKYEDMKEEIKKLNLELQEKTIVKYYLHPSFAFCFALLLLLAIIILEFLNKN